MNRLQQLFVFGVLTVGLLMSAADHAKSVPPPCKKCKCKEYDIVRDWNGTIKSLGNVVNKKFEIVKHAWGNGLQGKRYSAACNTGPDVPQSTNYKMYTWRNADDGCFANAQLANGDVLENLDPGNVAPVPTMTTKLQVLCTAQADEIPPVEEPTPIEVPGPGPQ